MVQFYVGQVFDVYVDGVSDVWCFVWMNEDVVRFDCFFVDWSWCRSWSWSCYWSYRLCVRFWKVVVVVVFVGVFGLCDLWDVVVQYGCFVVVDVFVYQVQYCVDVVLNGVVVFRGVVQSCVGLVYVFLELIDYVVQ